MKNRTRRGALAAAGLIGLAAFAAGQNRQDVSLAAHDPGNDYRVTILVSNEAGRGAGRRPEARQRVGHRRERHGPMVGRRQRQRLLHDLQRRRRRSFRSRSRFPARRPAPSTTAARSSRWRRARPRRSSSRARTAPSPPGTRPWTRTRSWSSAMRAPTTRASPSIGDVLYSTDFAECKVEAFHGNFFDGSFEEFDTAGGFEDHSIPAGLLPLRDPGRRRLDLRHVRAEGRR